MKKFLIVKTSSLGDIIQAFPAANYLRQKFPDAMIDWVVERPFGQLVSANPDIDNMIAVDTHLWRKNLWNSSTVKAVIEFKRRIQREHYDAIFDLQGNTKSGLCTYLACGDAKVGFARQSVAEAPNLIFTRQRFNPSAGKNIRDEYLEILQRFFKDPLPFSPISQKLKLSLEEQKCFHRVKNQLASLGPNMMICPGSAWPNKQLSKETLLDFLNRLNVHCSPLFVLVWGTPAEYEWAQSIHQEFPHSLLLERLSLPVLQNIMDEMDHIIAMDSLPLHLAGTTQTATFSIFGPSLAAKFKPQGTRHFSLQGNCPYHREFAKRCPVLRTCPTGACLKSLSGETLFDFYVKNL